MDSKTTRERKELDSIKSALLGELKKNFPGETLSEIIEKEKFTLDIAYANVPLKNFKYLKEGYDDRIKNGEIKEYFIFPAWWFPEVMETIVEKELLPFACYIRK